MNAPFHPDTVGLDQLKVGTKARVASVAWDSLDEGEGCRLQHFGFDEGDGRAPAPRPVRPRPDRDSRRPNDGGDPAQACRCDPRHPDKVNLPLVAVAGSPNAGKSALFNALTGARQKVGNYPGVTVERKSGRLMLADGRPVELVDLPGAYSLDAASPDEAVTRDVLLGQQKASGSPTRWSSSSTPRTSATISLRASADRAGASDHCRAQHGRSRAATDWNSIRSASKPAWRLVIETVAVRRRGIHELQAAVDDMLSAPRPRAHTPVKSDLIHLQRRARDRDGGGRQRDAGPAVDAPARPVLLHPVAGPLILAAIMFVMFQAVAHGQGTPVAWIKAASPHWPALQAVSFRMVSCNRWSWTA